MKTKKGKPTKQAKAEPCRHPVTRRIGKSCAVCGQQVGGK